MENLNYAFFEEFKKLNILCEEMYNQKNGVTLYIDRMKAVPASSYRNISGWETDLKRLTQIRHLRNNLAHTEGSFYTEECSEDDIEWLEDFYYRILNQTDPLAMLRKSQNNQNRKHSSYYRETKKPTSASPQTQSYAPKPNTVRNFQNPSQIPKSNSNQGCYIATCVYGSYDCPQVWTLRRFRDFTLAKSFFGRAFISIYYAVSPGLVKCFGNTSLFKNFWQKRLDRMIEKLSGKGVENTPYNDRDF